MSSIAALIIVEPVALLQLQLMQRARLLQLWLLQMTVKRSFKRHSLLNTLLNV